MAKLVRLESGSPRVLLARIVERTELVAAIERLSAPVLGQLIEHVGLEDAGVLVAAASTRQLQRVWDRDLWTRDAGDVKERFDPDRFAVWLEVMLEAGAARTAQRLCELPFDLLTLAVHRLVRVVDRGTWSRLDERELDDDDEEGAGGLHAPWHELVLIARDEQAWDAVWTALLALDEEDHALLRRVLDRCCDLDVEGDPWDGEDAGGLGDRSDDAHLEGEVAAERDARHAASGWVSSSDASSFLRLAREEHAGSAAALARDAVTRAYFREVDCGEGPAVQDGARADEGDAELLGLLADSGVLVGAPATAPALPATTADSADTAVEAPTPLHAALRALEREDPRLWVERMEELGYLANVVLAGCRESGRAPSPRSALRAATAVASLGLELQLPRRAAVHGSALLGAVRAASADRLFRAGCAALHRDLVRPAWHVLGLRVARYGDTELRERFRAAEIDEDLGELARDLDAEVLRMRRDRLVALCGLSQSVPELAGALAVRDARFVTTRVHLRAAKRFLYGLQR